MIRLRTLGQLSLDQEGTPVASVLAQPKRLGLLVYLAAGHSHETCSRDTLVALLWPELDEAHARTALRQALHLLRRSLGPGAIAGSGDARVGVDPSQVWCDAVAFGEAIRRADPASALGLYRGPFLDGFHVSDAPEFERWAERERRRLELEAIAAAWSLSDESRREGDAVGCRRWAERALELAPYDEVTFRRYLAVLEEQADAAAAVTAFAAYERRLAEDLGLEPSGETSSLMERIRTAASTPRPVHSSRAAVAEVREPDFAAPTQADPRRSDPSARIASATSRRATRWARWGSGVAALATLAGVLVLAHGFRPVADESEHTAIAVLPFRSLGSDTAHAYFADALHDELLNQLGHVSSLRVVGRMSVDEYGQSSEPLRRIAADLGVTRIVEGSVQIVGGRLRVVAQLLDPYSGEEIWAEHYDRTLSDAFLVESEISQRIVAAVGVSLTGAEAGAMRVPPTQDVAAYRLYLQGLEYSRRQSLQHDDDVAAAQLLERALALDSTFAPAHAELSFVYWRMYDLGYDRTPARLELARREAEAALRLAPGLPRAHLVIGITEHMARGDLRGALREFRIGVRGAPSDAELWTWIGIAYRPLGEWDSVFAALDRARLLEPRDADLPFAIGEVRHYLHRYPEAIEAYRQALALAPDFRQAHLSLAWSYFLWQGQFDTLKAVLRSIPGDPDPGAGGGSVSGQRAVIFLWERNLDSLRALLPASEANGAIAPSAHAISTAEVLTVLGDTAAARRSYEASLVFLDSAVRAAPDDWALHGTRGVVLGALGRRAEALAEARWIANTDLYRNDRATDGWMMGTRARIFAQAGAKDEALAELEKALSRPSVTTVHELRMSPDYDPIRSDPRFQSLLTKYADPLQHH